MRADGADPVRTGLDVLGLGCSYAERMHDKGYSDWDSIQLFHHCELEDCARECGMNNCDAQKFVAGMLKRASPLQQEEVLIDAAEEMMPAVPLRQVRLALACITKCPTNMGTWLEHFSDRIGVEHFFMRVEETPELAELFGQPRWRNTIHATFASGATEADNGPALCARMDRHTANAISHARELGCTHLLLVDDDELLYAPSGRSALHTALQRIPAGIAELHVRVLEALYPPRLADAGASDEACRDVFREVTAFKHRPGEYSRYGWQCGSTGKSIGVLSIEGLSPAGPRARRLSFCTRS